jgi:hypothetical protein
MRDTYIFLAFVLSLIEAGLIVYRFRARPNRTTTLLYATAAAILTFFVTVFVAQMVWGIVRSTIGGGGGGGGVPNPDMAALTLNLSALTAGVTIILVTAVVTAGATLAGVRVGAGLGGQGGREGVQPAVLPTMVAGVSLASLRQALTERLDVEELANLAFDLGIDLDSLPDSGTSGRVRELLEYLYRRGELERLVALLRQRRPDIQL